jgi:hypothetical protein
MALAMSDGLQRSEYDGSLAKEYSGTLLISSGVISLFAAASVHGHFFYFPIFATMLLCLWQLCRKHPRGLEETLPLVFLGATIFLGWLFSYLIADFIRHFAERLYAWSPDITIGGGLAVAVFATATAWIQFSERRET